MSTAMREKALDILASADNSRGFKNHPEYPCPACASLQGLPENSPNRIKSK